MVPQIWGKYGLALILRLLTTVPNPFKITFASSDTCRDRMIDSKWKRPNGTL